jgi:hypothetical protein
VLARPITMRAPFPVRLLASLLLVAACGSPSDGSPADGSPETGGASWSALPPSPLSPRHDPVGAWHDGRFVVVGGAPGGPCPAGADCAADRPPLRDGAAYDPASRRWTDIAEAPTGVAATVGPSVVAGSTLYVRSSTRLLGYDIDGDVWRPVEAPPQPYDYLTAAGDRLVAFAGGASDDGGRAFVLGEGGWRPLPPDPLGAVTDRWLLWTGDRLMVAGHAAVPDDEAPLVSIAFLDTDLATWGPAQQTAVIGWAPVAVAGRVVWPSTQSADGGEVGGWGRSYDEGGILDPVSGVMERIPEAPAGEGGTCCAVTTGRYVDVFGHLLDPVDRTWLETPPPPGGPRAGAAMVGSDEAVLLWGGAPVGRESEGSRASGYLLQLPPPRT